MVIIFEKHSPFCHSGSCWPRSGFKGMEYEFLIIEYQMCSSDMTSIHNDKASGNEHGQCTSQSQEEEDVVQAGPLWESRCSHACHRGGETQIKS